MSTTTDPNAIADISAQSSWADLRREREADVARLRAEQPVSWQRQPEGLLVTADGAAEDAAAHLTGGYSPSAATTTSAPSRATRGTSAPGRVGEPRQVVGNVVDGVNLLPFRL